MTKAEKEISNYIKARERDLRNGIVTIDEAALLILKAIKEADDFSYVRGESFDNLGLRHKAFVMLSKATKQ